GPLAPCVPGHFTVIGEFTIGEHDDSLATGSPPPNPSPVRGGFVRPRPNCLSFSGARHCGNGLQTVLVTSRTVAPIWRLRAAATLTPKTWYGMPAYANDGNVICYFQSAGKFKVRYRTLGFSDKAKVGGGATWRIQYALSELSATEEAKITALVKKAVR